MSMRVLSSPEAIEKADVMRRVDRAGPRRAARRPSTRPPAGCRTRTCGTVRTPCSSAGSGARSSPRLEQARADLADLRNRIDAICGDILVAGGSGR